MNSLQEADQFLQGQGMTDRADCESARHIGARQRHPIGHSMRCGYRAGLGEDGADRRGDHLGGAFGDLGQDVDAGDVEHGVDELCWQDR